MRVNPIAEAFLHGSSQVRTYPNMCSECPGRPACDAPALSLDAEATAARDFIADKGHQAIRDGQQLEQWCRKRGRNLNLFPIVLRQTYDLAYSTEGFYDSVEINGELESVMGCRQEVELGSVTAGNAPALLREFVLGEFMNRANWVNNDGSMGGFLVRKCFHKNMAGVIDRFEPGERNGCIDWRQLGTKYEWVLLTMYLNDFVMDFGPYRKRFKECLGFLAHPSFVHVVENPSEDDLLEVTIGYPVAGYAPIPNHFGFGPGKFGVAIQYYSFLLSRKNEVKVTMMFAAAPRCRKVLDFGKHIPDPVYGGAELLHYLTFGLWQPDQFHDKLDAGMLAQHCRVHQSLMDGVGKVWTDWLGAATRLPEKE